MWPTKARITQFVYGKSIIEAIVLDMILNTMSDGLPRPYAALTTPVGELTTHDVQRKIDLLFDNNMLKQVGSNVVITAKGSLHLAKGGYTNEVKRHKHLSISFCLSIFATLVSTFAIIITWLRGS